MMSALGPLQNLMLSKPSASVSRTSRSPLTTRANSTWTLPNQVGWPFAKELLFSGRLVEAEEAYRIGLLNHLVPCDQLRDKTMWLGTMIAKNRRESVMGVKALLLEDMGCDLEEQWTNEREYTTKVVRGAKADAAFPEFIARKGRPASS